MQEVMDRKTQIKITILEVLDNQPSNFPMREPSLIAEVQNTLSPRPSVDEVKREINALDTCGYISGTVNDFTLNKLWIIKAAGRLVLQNAQDN